MTAAFETPGLPPAAPWINKILLASTDGSMVQTLFRAVVARPTVLPPHFGSFGIISADGYLFCNFRSRDGKEYAAARVCHIDEYIRKYRVLADRAHLSDTEREDMFKELRMFIRQDHRNLNPDGTQS